MRSFLKWLAILAPIGFVGALEIAGQGFRPPEGAWRSHLLLPALVALGAVCFNGVVFTIWERRQAQLECRNRELAALRSASLDISSELSLEVVLQKIVDQARNLIGTRYGALSVIDDTGKIRNFITSGIDARTRQEIGDPPVGHGLLGVVLREGQHLRLESIRADSRSVGFPERHPPMESLLAIPVICRSPFRGNLYLSEKQDRSAFTPDDQDTLARFASQTAIAVDNAHLHEKVRSLAAAEERLRIAREMHDGQAQVLAFVITKAQAVSQFLKAGRQEEAQQHLDQLTSAAREVYIDVREGILGLRSVQEIREGLSSVLRGYIENWETQSGIEPLTEIEDVPVLPTDVELQLLRIAQEALTNVRKHSQSERVSVRLAALPGKIRLEIEDQGSGFTVSPDRPHRQPRFGLSTMRERAEAIGASLLVDSRPEEGTLVQLDYPYDD